MARASPHPSRHPFPIRATPSAIGFSTRYAPTIEPNAGTLSPEGFNEVVPSRLTGTDRDRHG